MLKTIPLLIIIVLGIAGILVLGYYSIIDWSALQDSYSYFSGISQGTSDFTVLFAAEAQQNIHWINLFAEGVWTLQCAILVAIGFHGLCALPKRIGG